MNDVFATQRSRIRGGLTSITFRKLAPPAIIEAVLQAGLDGIEWGGDVHVPPGDIARAEAVGQATRDAGLVVSSYGSYFAAGEDQDFAPILDSAVALGAPTIRIWAGRRPSTDADAEYRRRVEKEAQRCAETALAKNVRLAFELHGGTLTDAPESATDLLRRIAAPNVGSYWQPDYWRPEGNADIEQDLESLRTVAPWLSHLHVYHWRARTERRPLSEGQDAWLAYLREAAALPGERFALLEFVRDDDIEAFMQDAATLKTWLQAPNIFQT